MCPFTDVSVRGESWCQQKRGGEGWCGEEGRKGKVFSNWRPIDFYPSPACMQLQLQLVNFNHIRRCRGTLSVRVNLCRIANWKHLGGRCVSRNHFFPRSLSIAVRVVERDVNGEQRPENYCRKKLLPGNHQLASVKTSCSLKAASFIFQVLRLCTLNLL